MKRGEFLPGRINSDFILNNRVSVSQYNMEEDERNRMIFAKDENVGERQYTLIGHYINCTDLQITTGYIPLNPITSVPRVRCPLAGVRSLPDKVPFILVLASSACPEGEAPAARRGVPIAASDSWGSYFLDGWQRCPPGLGMAPIGRD